MSERIPRSGAVDLDQLVAAAVDRVAGVTLVPPLGGALAALAERAGRSPRLGIVRSADGVISVELRITVDGRPELQAAAETRRAVERALARAGLDRASVRVVVLGE